MELNGLSEIRERGKQQLAGLNLWGVKGKIPLTPKVLIPLSIPDSDQSPDI